MLGKMSGGLRRAVLRELMTASAQQTHAGGRNENKLAQGYKNPTCIGRDGIEKATAMVGASKAAGTSSTGLGVKEKEK